MTRPYEPRRTASSRFVDVRGLRYHCTEWGDASMASGGRPTLVMAHGWMDVGASFQFIVDELATDRHVVALDWRGFGRSQVSGADCYWFPDYLADLDVLLDHIAPGTPVDLVGHSMGGNIAMIYAGVRPARVRRLVNLEGFGMPETKPQQAPKRYAKWLDELRATPSLRSYDSVDAVAARLRKNDPRLAADKAAWLAAHWSERRDDGRFHILGDPAHKRVNPILYHKEEVLECWRRIEAPLLWAEGDATDLAKWWGERYTRADFDARLAVVPRVERHRIADCGHMLHHDQPHAVAQLVELFVAR